jgi:hypothetical protein
MVGVNKTYTIKKFTKLGRLANTLLCYYAAPCLLSVITNNNNLDDFYYISRDIDSMGVFSIKSIKLCTTTSVEVTISPLPNYSWKTSIESYRRSTSSYLHTWFLIKRDVFNKLINNVYCSNHEK